MTTTTTKPPYRRDPIPIWINVLSGLIALILLFQSLSAYLAPTWAYGAFDLGSEANRQVMTTLGGRNVVMLVATLFALRWQNAALLALTFVMHFARELQDMFIVPYYVGIATAGGIAQLLTFLIVFVIPEFLAFRRLHRIAANRT